MDLPGIARVPVGDQPEEWLGWFTSQTQKKNLGDFLGRFWEKCLAFDFGGGLLADFLQLSGMLANLTEIMLRSFSPKDWGISTSTLMRLCKWVHN